MKQLTRITLFCVVLALALSQVATASSAVLKRAAEIISKMETNGNYGSVANDSNGSPSVGILQWNNGRAVRLLKKIIADDAAAAKTLLGDALYTQLANGGSSVWSKKKLTSAQRSAVGALLKTGNGVSRQDAQAETDIAAYIDKAKSLGIKDPNALVYYADIAHQAGTGAVKKYAVKAAAIAGGYDKITLKSMYEAALVYATYTKARRTKVYNMLVANPVDGSSADAEILPESVTLSPSAAQVLYLGGSLQLTAAVSPSGASAALAWSTSSSKIATVSGGAVTPKKAGNVLVTVRTQNGKTASVKVVVRPVLVTSVSITGDNAMKRGARQTLGTVCAPENATNQTVRWRSSRSSVAAVNSKGVVLARKRGKAIIYCMTRDGTRRIAKLIIRVS